MLKISNREFSAFKKLQETNHEIGGKIILNSKGVKKTELVNGTKQNVFVSQFPVGLLWFHTHPNIPALKSGETSYTNVIKQMEKKKNKDFIIDTIVQPISDDDLLALTSSIREQKTCMMAVFTPEGIYLMSQGENINKGKSNKFSKVIIKIEKKRIRPTASQIKLLPNFDNKTTRKELIKKAKLFLKERDELILDNQELLIPKINKAKTLATKISVMKIFQKNIGKKVATLSNKIYPYIKVDFYHWNTKFIKINSNRCAVPNK